MKEVASYNSPQGFAEEAIDSLVDIDLNDSTELWLIQLPEDHSPDFDGEEVSLDLRADGQLGSLKGSTGKLYNMLNYASQESDTIVFLSSSSRPRIAGKISRHVSLAHYPEPEELKPLKTDAQKQRPFSSATSFSKSQMSQKHSQSQSKSRSIHRKSHLSQMGDASKSSKRNSGEPSRFSDQDSGHVSGITTSGLSEQSQRKKSKKRADI